MGKVQKGSEALASFEKAGRDHYVEIPPYLKWKPEFNDAYVDLTLQLKQLCTQANQAKSQQERATIQDKIRLLKKKRSAATTYTDRDFGL